MIVDFLLEKWPWVIAWLAVLAILLRYEASKGAKGVSATQMSQLVNHEDGIIVDVREEKKFSQGHIAGSLNIPSAVFAKRMSELNAYKDKPVILVCHLGQTAGSLSKQLKAQQFSRVYKLSGGTSEWTAAGLPLIKQSETKA